MTWTTPFTFVDGDPLEADDLNTLLRDNMNETEPAKATTAGSYFSSTGWYGPKSIVEQRIRHTESEGTISISSTSWVTAASDEVIRVKHSGALLILFAARIHTEGLQDAFVSIDVKSTTDPGSPWPEESVGPRDYAAIAYPGDKTDIVRSFGHAWIYGWYSGTARVRLSYRVAGGKAFFAQRSLTVLPF